jgi:hypothetical protein
MGGRGRCTLQRPVRSGMDQAGPEDGMIIDWVRRVASRWSCFLSLLLYTDSVNRLYRTQTHIELPFEIRSQ